MTVLHFYRDGPYELSEHSRQWDSRAVGSSCRVIPNNMDFEVPSPPPFYRQGGIPCPSSVPTAWIESRHGRTTPRRGPSAYRLGRML
jgi:hypothetical protein